MSQRTFIVWIGLMAVIASGCVEFPSQKILYKDSDVEVIRHEPLVIMADGASPYFELIALGHSYKLSCCLDYSCDGCDGFARTPNSSAIVFIAESQRASQADI